jgi:hypothetical protein
VKSATKSPIATTEKGNTLQLVILFTLIDLLWDWASRPPLFPHPLLARLLERTVKRIIDVQPLATPTGVHVEERVFGLGAPLLRGPLPGVGVVPIDGVHR